MAGILCLPIRISSKSAILHIRQISSRRTNTIIKTFAVPLLNSASTTFSYRTNSNCRNILSLSGVHSRWFKTSIAHYEDMDVHAPEFPEAVASGDIKWRKKVGDSVAIDEVVCELETDKTSIEVPSPGNGVIVEQYVAEGAAVKSKQKVFRITLGPGAAKTPDKQPPAHPTPPKAVSVPQAVQKPQAAKEPPRVPATPVPAAAPKPSMPLPSVEKAVFKVPPQDPTREITGTRTEFRVKMSKMRLVISQRLKQAQIENAMLTTFNEIDMSNVIAFRKANQEAFTKKHGIKLGFMSAFVKASAYALEDQPIVNACIMGNEIVYRDYIDISIAVATPKGILVPVLRNVSPMNFADIEKKINNFGNLARKGKLAIEDMDGGTFTISNGGVFGSLMGTPIINPPQSAILGMHATLERPVAIKGQVVIRPMMYVALTYDHRLIDGREAVLFLRKIKAGVENPSIIIAGM